MGGAGTGKAVWARAFLELSPVARSEKDLILTGEGKQGALPRTGLFCGKFFLALHLTFEREAKV